MLLISKIYKGQKNTLNKLENNIISNNIISFDIHDYKCLFINTSKEVYLYDISSNKPATLCKDICDNTIEKATQEEIQEFLLGNDPEKHIVALEYGWRSGRIYKIKEYPEISGFNK